MSDSIVFFPKRLISFEEYASVISELGGTPTPLPIGSSISSGEATVYCIFATDLTDTDYHPEQIQELKDFLGMAPQVYIYVDIGHGNGSYELASRVFAHFDRRFGCIIDDLGTGVAIEGEKMVWKKEYYD